MSLAADTVGLWPVVAVAGAFTAAIALAALAIWLVPRRQRMGPAGNATLSALVFTALWCVALAAIGPETLVSSFAETIRNLAWLYVLFRLFAGEGDDADGHPFRFVLWALCFVEVLHLGTDLSLARYAATPEVMQIAFEFTVLFRLLVAVGSLVLLHNLYLGASREERRVLRWPVGALALLWICDLNFYSIAYLLERWPTPFVAFRGFAGLGVAGLLAVFVSRDRAALRLRPSRAVTFHTVSLLVIGGYLAAMIAVAQLLAGAGGSFGRLVELGFLVVASAFALVVLPSRKVRGLIKVVLAKHLFQHRYDYREEWLRFTQTIGSGSAQARPLGERIVQAIADVTDSEAGLLLTPGEHGDLNLASRWMWPEAEVPGAAFPARALGFFEQASFIADLDEIRAGARPVSERTGAALEVPEWLLADPRAWALVPLCHYERLVGMVVLARPQIARRFDWEDFDLLRVVGQQLASYLAENTSQEALAEASRFDDFHRRIAFVMHDIKNLASQFSLLARNAELHADKPAFRADMLVTLRNSSEKLNALIARLSRYGSGSVDKLEDVSAREVIEAVMVRFADCPQVTAPEIADLLVSANRHSLEQVLVHLVQNAVDASDPGSPVLLTARGEGLTGHFEVRDSGCGMSAEFVRSRLFKPFVSTKQGGFGIGAFEARELVRAMRGRLEVESREGLGSRFEVAVPLAVATDMFQSLARLDQKVA